MLHRCIRLLAIRFQVSCRILWLLVSSQIQRTICHLHLMWLCISLSRAISSIAFPSKSTEVSGSQFHANTLMSAKAMDTCLHKKVCTVVSCKLLHFVPPASSQLLHVLLRTLSFSSDSSAVTTWNPTHTHTQTPYMTLEYLKTSGPAWTQRIRYLR